MIKSKDKKVQLWVHPSFKNNIKIRAAMSGESIISFTKRIGFNKKDFFNDEGCKDEENVRY